MSENEAFAKYDDSRQKNEEMPFLKQLFLHSNMHVSKAWFNGLIRLSITDLQELQETTKNYKE